MAKDVIVIGAGGHSKVVIATAQAMGYTIKGVYDSDRSKIGSKVLNCAVIGHTDDLKSANDLPLAIIAVGDNKARKQLAETLNLKWATLIHPSCIVHPSVRIGEGTVIFAGAIVQPSVKVGRHVIVNTSASVDHDCVLGDFTQIAPGVRLSGNTRVLQGALLGTGSCTIPGIEIGAWATLGAGSTAIQNVSPDSIVAGSPAKLKV